MMTHQVMSHSSIVELRVGFQSSISSVPPGRARQPGYYDDVSMMSIDILMWRLCHHIRQMRCKTLTSLYESIRQLNKILPPTYECLGTHYTHKVTRPPSRSTSRSWHRFWHLRSRSWWSDTCEAEALVYSLQRATGVSDGMCTIKYKLYVRSTFVVLALRQLQVSWKAIKITFLQ